MKTRKLVRMVARWQKRLDLRDWDIRVRKAKLKGNMADVYCVPEKRYAEIRMDTRKSTRRNNRFFDVNRSIVHELVHVHLSGCTSKEVQLVEEQAVHALSLAILKGR